MPGAVSFEVGAIFMIEDRASAVLANLSEKFTVLDERIATTKGELMALGKGEVFTGLNAAISNTARELATMATAAKGMADGIISTIASVATSAKTAMSELAALKAEMNAINQTPVRPGGGGGGGGGGLPGGTPRMMNTGPRAPESREIAELPGGVPALRLPEEPNWDEARNRYFNARQDELPFGAPGVSRSRTGGPIATNPNERLWSTNPETMIPPPPRPFGGGLATEEAAIVGGAGGVAASRGGGHRGAAGLVAAGEAFLVYEMVKGAATKESALSMGLMRGFNLKPSENKEMMTELGDISQEGVGTTSISEIEGSKSIAALAIALQIPYKDFKAIAPAALRAAEAAKIGGFGDDPVKSIVSGADVAHMVQGYGAKEYEENTEMLSKISRTTRTTMQAEATALSYVLPQAHLLGMDTQEVMEYTAFLQRAGLKGSVGASTLRQMIVAGHKGDTHTKGGKVVHHEKGELERALNMKEGHLSDMSGQRGGKRSAHVQAGYDLGLFDEKGNLTYLNSDGSENLGMMMEIASTHASTMTDSQAGGAFYNWAGIRGEQASMIARNPESVGKFQEFMRHEFGSQEYLTEARNQTTQKVGQAVARTSDFGVAIGEGLQPLVNAVSIWVADLMTAGRLLVKEYGGSVTTPLAVGAVGAGLSWLTWKGASSLIGGLFRGAARGAGAIETGAGLAGGAEGVAGAVAGRFALGSLFGPIGQAIALGSLMLTARQMTGDDDAPKARGLPSMFYKQDGGIKWPWSPDTTNTEKITPRAGVELTPSGEPRAAAKGPTTVTITVGPITMNGVADEGTFQGLLKRMTESIKHAMETATGTGQGSTSSPFVYGGQ